MIIYLASSYTRAPEMQGVRDVLQALGHEVTSRWIDNTDINPEPLMADRLNRSPQLGVTPGRIDTEDLTRADMVIAFTGFMSTSGGYHTEIGMALGSGKKLAIVGPRENVFHCAPQIEHYPSWAHLVMALSPWNTQGEPPWR